MTVPTAGRIEMRGRMGSMLEVNAGFHPELTGRENVFLTGSILGMRRREILAKFDQIVEFSEIGQHLDTPVKRYSSGQYVRLAFAVTAYLEPEILIVDEVLAVGDADVPAEVHRPHGRSRPAGANHPVRHAQHATGAPPVPAGGVPRKGAGGGHRRRATGGADVPGPPAGRQRSATCGTSTAPATAGPSSSAPARATPPAGRCRCSSPRPTWS